MPASLATPHDNAAYALRAFRVIFARLPEFDDIFISARHGIPRTRPSTQRTALNVIYTPTPLARQLIAALGRATVATKIS